MWPFALSGRLMIIALVGSYPANWLIIRELISRRLRFATTSLSAITSRFQKLWQSERQITHALLTRSPLSATVKRACRRFSFDLHVLGVPPAFVLSQDRTL